MNTLDPTLDIVFKLLFGGPKSQKILIALLTAVLQPKSALSMSKPSIAGLSRPKLCRAASEAVSKRSEGEP